MTRRLLLSLGEFLMSCGERLIEASHRWNETRTIYLDQLHACEQRHTKLEAERDDIAWNVRSCGRHLRLVDTARREDQQLIAALKSANAEQAKVIKALSLSDAHRREALQTMDRVFQLIFPEGMRVQ